MIKYISIMLFSACTVVHQPQKIPKWYCNLPDTVCCVHFSIDSDTAFDPVSYDTIPIPQKVRIYNINDTIPDWMICTSSYLPSMVYYSLKNKDAVMVARVSNDTFFIDNEIKTEYIFFLTQWGHIMPIKLDSTVKTIIYTKIKHEK